MGIVAFLNWKSKDIYWYQSVRIDAQYDGREFASDTVVKVVWSHSPLAQMLSQNPWTREVFGFAPMLELPDGAAIFVLLQPSGMAQVLSKNAGILNADDRRAAMAAGGVPPVVLEIPTTQAPFVVSLRDVTDVASISVVGADTSDARIEKLGAVRVTVSPSSQSAVTPPPTPLPAFLADPVLRVGQSTGPSSPNAFQTPQGGWAYATIDSFIKE